HAPLLGPQSQPYTGPRATGNTLQPWMMGLVGATITPALLKTAGYPNAKVRGVVVLSVVNGTAAQRAGIQRGDIIVVVNRVAVVSMEQLLQLTTNRRSGVATALIFFRNGTPLQVLVPVNGSTATPQQWRPPTIGPGYVRPTSGPANQS
ncbi:MAG TPA: S1C family serine protease, partial [Candidatus Rubrimentiphilum sp.]|nr:S1C family serine protease [Candidatus Rubrimentiphilum sp.]